MFATPSTADLGNVRGGSSCVWAGLGAGAGAGTITAYVQSVFTRYRMTKGDVVRAQPKYLGGALAGTVIGFASGCAVGAASDGVERLIGSTGRGS